MNEGLIKRVETLENERSRLFVGLSHANISINALCDVLESLISDYIDTQYSGAGAENTDEMLFDLVKARIYTGNKEAQDETASDNARVENNTVGNTLRSNDLVCDGDTFDAQLEALRDELLKLCHIPDGCNAGVNVVYRDSVSVFADEILRPHLEQWAQKVAEAEAKLMGIDLVVSGCVAPEIVNKRLDCAAYRNACEFRKERDALKAEVEKLKRPCSCGGEGKLYGEDEDVWVYCGCRIGKDMHINDLQTDLEKAWDAEASTLEASHYYAESKAISKMVRHSSLKDDCEFTLQEDNIFDVGMLIGRMDELKQQIEQLEKDKARLLDAIGRCGKRCEHLHHEKKHQHGLGEDCPVENLVREAIDNAKGGE